MRCDFSELSRNFAKALLLILNVLSVISALCTFGFAVVDIRILQQYSEEQSSGSTSGDIVIIAVSLLLVIVACLGIYGAIREQPKILYLYAGFLMIMVLLELLIGIFVSVNRFGLELRVTNWLRDDFFNNSTTEEQSAHDKVWDELQTTYECCGLNGPEDYQILGQTISLSCCQKAYRVQTTHIQKRLYQMCIEMSITADVYCEELNTMMEKLAHLPPALVNCSAPLLLHHNARPHTAQQTVFKLQEHSYRIQIPAPQKNDVILLSPSHKDFYVFTTLDALFGLKKLPIELRSSSYYTQGCEYEILHALHESSESLFGVALIVLWFEVIGALLAMCLVNNLRNSVQVYKYTVKY